MVHIGCENGAATLSKTTFSITALTILGFFATLSMTLSVTVSRVE
jgi:hypothetical protein